jgi:hypothetical protein
MSGDRIDIRGNVIEGDVTGAEYHLHISPRAVLALGAVLVVVLLTVSGQQPVKDAPSAKAPVRGAAATVVDPARVDPCGLLDAAVLARFGETRIDANYGEFDRCDVVVHDRNSDRDVALVKLHFANSPAELDPRTPTKRFGQVTVAEMQGDSDECLRNLKLPDRNEIWIEAAEIRPPAPDLCALAGAAIEHVVKVLNRGPVPERETPANSLARLDACRLLDAEVQSELGEVDEQDPGFANWECEWENTGTRTFVEVSFSQDNDPSDDGRPLRLGGRQAYVTPREYDDHNCVVRVEHRNYTDTAGDPTYELVVVAVHAPGPIGEVCGTAKTLAGAAARKLSRWVAVRGHGHPASVHSGWSV